METTRSAALLRMARSIFASRAEGAEAEEGAEGGFTLIELMVVLLIMAILLAIAIPTFLGVKGGAQNRAVQSDLTNAVTSAKAYYTNLGSYPVSASLAGQLGTNEPEMTFNAGAVTYSTASPHNVSVWVSPDGYITILAEQAQNTTCWYVEDNETAAVGNDGVTPPRVLTRASNTLPPVGRQPPPGTAAVGTTTPPSGWKAAYPTS